ncbi:MAG: hypothetical protein JXB14_05710 [Candidatus Altiarchaeota archaeon]|nr:hypothetical protein [Candidatus Altiarchaeota archaeon]
MGDDVSTTMDQLVELLEKSSMVKISDAAKELEVDKDRIESWARMLEKAEAVEIHYSVIGGAVLKRGPKFDSIIRKKKIEAQEKALDEIKPSEPMEATKAPEEEKVERIEIPKQLEGDQKYLLIRKKIEDEERIIDMDIKHLQEEEAKVIDYMRTLVEEGKKLTDYIETLREMLTEIEKQRKSSQKSEGGSAKQKG